MSLELIRRLLEPSDHLMERVVDTKTMWKGHIFTAELLTVSTPDGELDAREVIMHHGGCGVAAVRDGKICLVRQYRVAPGRMTLEIPAGKIDPGEDPAVCAARELAEETGLEAERLELIANSSGAPGFTNEKTRVFYAHGLHASEAHPDEGEFVDVVWIPVDDVLEAIRAGLIEDAKTVVAVLAVKAGLFEG